MTVIPIRSSLAHTLSDDSAWSYDQVDDGDGDGPETQVCLVTHRLTGLRRSFPTIVEAHAWASMVDAPAVLAAAAREILTHPFSLLEEKARARRALMLLAGTLVSAAAEVEYLCRCGGYLTADLLHVDTCVEELGAAADGSCPDDRNTHVVCDRPAPAVCDHDGCPRPNLIHTSCPVGHDVCCGHPHGGTS